MKKLDQKFPSEKQNPKELLQKQSDRVEKEIIEFKNQGLSKSSQIFKIAERIKGQKGSNQEPSAVKNQATNEIVVSTNEVKKVVLNYCSVV